MFVNIVSLEENRNVEDTSLYPTAEIHNMEPIDSGFIYNSLMITGDDFKRFACAQSDTSDKRCSLLISIINVGAVGAAQLEEETFSISLSFGIQQLE